MDSEAKIEVVAENPPGEVATVTQGEPPKETKKEDDIIMRWIGPFKLKDRAQRSMFIIYPEREFGYSPKMIVIQKVRGSNNMIQVGGAISKVEHEKYVKEKQKALEETVSKEVSDNGQRKRRAERQPGETGTGTDRGVQPDTE